MLGLGKVFIPGGGPDSILDKPFAGNVLTADEQRYRRACATIAAEPGLALGDPTVGWARSALAASKAFANPQYPQAIRTPILFVAAGDDRVVDTRAIERFAARVKYGRCIVLPHARHEILMERDEIRQQFWDAFDAFLPGEAAADGEVEAPGETPIKAEAPIEADAAAQPAATRDEPNEPGAEGPASAEQITRI